MLSNSINWVQLAMFIVYKLHSRAQFNRGKVLGINIKHN